MHRIQTLRRIGGHNERGSHATTVGRIDCTLHMATIGVDYRLHKGKLATNGVGHEKASQLSTPNQTRITMRLIF